MNNWKSKILKKIKPSEKEHLKNKYFIEEIRKNIENFVGEKVIIAGSFAKDTYLVGDNDIDLIILFSQDKSKDDLKKILTDIAKNIFSNEKTYFTYADHPYLKVLINGFVLEIVPAFASSSFKKSVADRTPLHTEYINSHITLEERDEVRLLKAFLKANYLYGAEIKIQGISGYLAELLVLRYKSFESALKNISMWKRTTLIDLENQVSFKEASKKFPQNLIFIDPIDKNRNVASALSEKNYFTLIELAKKFLKANDKEKEKFFSLYKFKEKYLKNLAKKLYAISFTKPEVAEDIIWGQTKRFMTNAENFLTKEGFTLVGTECEENKNKIIIIFEVLNPILEKFKLVSGPPLWIKNYENFTTLYSDIFLNKNRINAIVKRENRSFLESLKSVKKIPLPSHLSSIKNAKVFKCSLNFSLAREAINRYAHYRFIFSNNFFTFLR